MNSLSYMNNVFVIGEASCLQSEFCLEFWKNTTAVYVSDKFPTPKIEKYSYKIPEELQNLLFSPDGIKFFKISDKIFFGSLGAEGFGHIVLFII